MPKYRVWYEVVDRYIVELEADNEEQLYDMVYENPYTSQKDAFMDSVVEIVDTEVLDG